MSVQPRHLQGLQTRPSLNKRSAQLESPSETFYYFAYGSCMCPVDLKRSLGEPTHPYAIGPATLKGYRLQFSGYSTLRNCGVLDVVKDPTASVEGVLYQLPWRLSDRLDEREKGYHREEIEISVGGQVYPNVRTYTVAHKLSEELPPNDWYFQVVLRGAVTCGLPESYCWHLFNYMHQLQTRPGQNTPLKSTSVYTQLPG
ncbi:gamma-glutamylcyclotransferase [Oscillatoria sp. HE19RPO]|uniref:gamma-glutamylcyclotransferase n=1 Tax=Oscillatoria sp. HE19RPO TaxID=2954806 RepID=UPI0020C4FE4D|nr:gamma-glutamylcyclotransferase [Oscillatoria sp. HE19RPO]